MKYKGLVPELSVANISESKKFYLDVLGFHLEYERVEDKFAFLSLGEAQMMIEEMNGSWNTAELMYPLGRGVNFQIEMEDVEGMAAALKDQGIKLFRDVLVNHYENDDGGVMVKEILVQDPDGYLLRFSQMISVGSSL
ncbi:bleomycin resistance protein [Peribacillus muralis]|uniref:bleomycin resistance protein n=1 Tax=Peribacillus muralis TaxID=264697 RepID=UPI003D08F5B0